MDSVNILNAAYGLAIESSTNAAPIVVTITGHPFATGDKVTIMSHATNTAANGTWTITKVDADTFELDGSTGNGEGAGTGTCADAGKIIDVSDFSTVVFKVATDGGGTAAMTVKCAGSLSDSAPDFAASQTVSNHYDYIDLIDLQDNASVDGDTGFVVATADDYRTFELNVGGMKYVTFVITAGTAGQVTIDAKLFNPNK